MMCGIVAALLGYALIPLVYQEDLYTPEKYLFYLAMETIIYEKQKNIGMLSVSAQLYYPPIVEEKTTQDSKKEPVAENHMHKPKNTKQQNQEIKIQDKINIANTNKQIEEDWV